MKQNQVIALVQGKKTRAVKAMTHIHHGWSRERVMGLTRNYSPLEEDGQKYPSESRMVQVKVSEVNKTAQGVMADLFNMVATQEYGNVHAKADIVVGGETIIASVPVSVLLFLEKQLIDLRTYVGDIPTLPTDVTWEYDAAKDCFVSEPIETIKTTKKPEVIVKYDATPEHPAQTELMMIDKPIGTWTTVHMSGAMEMSKRNLLLERVTALQDAVKFAREEANSTEVTSQNGFGEAILEHIFKS